MAHFEHLVAELRRRRVLPALLGWGVVAFAVLQVAEPVMHALELKDWVLKVVVAVLAAGFPVAAILSWSFDLGRRGVERTSDVAGTAKHGRMGALVGIVAVSAAVGAALALFALRTMERPAPPAAPEDAPSVAALPFADLSPGHDQEYLSDGIAEEILRALASVPGLKVPGRASSAWFKGKNVELPEIARKLGVAHLLTGSVKHSGTRVRVTAELVRAADGERVWTQAYERELSDVFAIEDDVSRSVVQAIAPVLLAKRHEARYPRTADPEAFRLMLLGRYLNGQASSESSARAVESLRRAVAIDPSYAPAQAFLYFASANLSATRRGPERERLIAESRRAADAAVAADPSFAVGHVARALARLRDDLDWTGAQADVETAMRLDPQDETVLNARALLLGWMGRIDEASDVQRKAVVRDPLNAIHVANLSILLVLQGRYEEAREWSRRVREIRGGGGASAFSDGWVALRTGEHAVALTAFEQADEPARSAGMVAALHALGRREEARAALARLEREYAGDLIAIAGAHAWSDDPDGAFAALDEAVRMRVLGRASVKSNPWLLPLHADGRFPQLLRRLGFPDKGNGG